MSYMTLNHPCVVSRSVLERVAWAISKNHGIRVIFRANECSTNSKIITLPALPGDLPDDLIQLVRGYLDHELGHVLFTDFVLYSSTGKDPIRQSMLNCVEDVFVERKMIETYPGTARALRAKFELCTQRLELEWGDLDSLYQIMVLILITARWGEDESFVQKYSPLIQPILDVLAPEIRDARTINSTQESLEVADRILEKLKDFVDQNREPPQETTSSEEPQEEPSSEQEPLTQGMKDAGKGGTEGKDTKSDGPREDAPSYDPGEYEEEEQGIDPGKIKPAPSRRPEKAGLSPLAQKLGAQMDRPVQRELDFARRLIQEQSKSLPDQYLVYDTQHDTFRPNHSYPLGFSNYNRIAGELKEDIKVLRNVLFRMLQSRKRTFWRGGKSQGLIDPARLHHIIQGTSEKVFHALVEGKKINTAVTLLIDCSGSMATDRKIEMAQLTTILLAETLNLLKVPFEILGYTTESVSRPDTNGFRNLPSYLDGYSRWGSLRIIYFKLYEETFGQIQKSRVGSMEAFNENLDGESLLFAANRLLLRDEPKKVMFVLSDGYPNIGQGRKDSVAPHLKSVCRRLESIPGFYLCALGILSGAPKKFYKNHILVKDLSKLPEELMNQLYKVFV